MARLVFNRSINIDLRKDEGIEIPKNEVWKVTIPVINRSQNCGISRINDSSVTTGIVSTSSTETSNNLGNFRPGGHLFGGGTKLEAYTKNEKDKVFISGIVFKVIN